MGTRARGYQVPGKDRTLFSQDPADVASSDLRGTLRVTIMLRLTAALLWIGTGACLRVEGRRRVTLNAAAAATASALWQPHLAAAKYPPADQQDALDMWRWAALKIRSLLGSSPTDRLCCFCTRISPRSRTAPGKILPNGVRMIEVCVGAGEYRPTSYTIAPAYNARVHM